MYTLKLATWCVLLTRYTSSRAVETVTSPPTPAASAAPATAAKKAPGSSVSVASEVVGICIVVGLVVIHVKGPIIIFNRKAVELNFFVRKTVL